MLIRLLLFLFLFIPTGCAPYLVVSGGAVNRDKLQEIKTVLTALRGLEFKAEVPIEVKNREEMRRYLERDLEREYGDERLQNMSLAYAKLGLFPKTLDLKKSLLDFYGTQVAAFYDPKAKRLVLPEELRGGFFVGAVQFIARRDILGEMVLAHELTHALQDQHFSLGDKLGPSANEDRALALRAVVEGDATLSGMSALLGWTDSESLARVTRDIERELKQKRGDLSHIPEAILEPLLFSYYGGAALVFRVLDERGWLGVNRLYAFPPLSTEQVLHPEKYLSLADPPTGIDLKELSSLFSPGWREIENNVLGELMVQVLFKQFLSEEEAKVVANGWDGDRFVAFRRGDEVAFLWATVWDSARDAEEFFQRYQEILSKKYAESETARSHAYIEQRDLRVIVVEGLERDHVKDRIEKIWQEMELKEEPFKVPFRPLSPGP